MFRLYTALVFVLVAAIALPLLAQQDSLPPPRISIQGTLKDANGVAVPDGDIQVKFDLYGQPTGGNTKWTETAVVEVQGGIYSHYLGSETDLEATVFDSTLFLGVTVGNFELSPRTELTYAPYTFAANTSLLAQEVICSGAVGDIKFSILAPADFASVNGDCWVPMDGRNIINTRLSVLTDEFQVPDASGAFLRGHEFAGGADRDPDRTPSDDVGTLQEDQILEHDHTFETYTGTTGGGKDAYSNLSIDKNSDGIHAHELDRAMNDNNGAFDDNNANATQPSAATTDRGTIATFNTKTTGSTHKHRVAGTTDVAMGGTETRPINLNFYVYIRVD